MLVLDFVLRSLQEQHDVGFELNGFKQVDEFRPLIIEIHNKYADLFILKQKYLDVAYLFIYAIAERIWTKKE